MDSCYQSVWQRRGHALWPFVTFPKWVRTHGLLVLADQDPAGLHGWVRSQFRFDCDLERKKKVRVIDTYIYISHFNICVIVASMRRVPHSCNFFFFSFCMWRSSVARDFVGILFDNECKTIWLFHMAFSSSDRWGTAWLLAKTCTYVPACVRKANRILNFSNEAKTVILVLSRWAGRKFHSLCVQNL